MKDQHHKNPHVYSIQVTGIKCTNCASKIIKNIGEILNDPETKISVNIIQEKVSLATFSQTAIDKTIENLIQMGYPPIGPPIQIQGNDDKHRSISFLVDQNQTTNKMELSLTSLLGIEKCYSTVMEHKKKINVSYNKEIIKGKELQKIIAEADCNYQVVNDRINSFSDKEKNIHNEINIFLTGFLCVYFFSFNVFFPILFSKDHVYQMLVTYPLSLGIFSYWIIFNIIVTLLVLVKYALPFIQRAILNYYKYRMLTMDTLIALGCSSAFLLFIFFVFQYSFGDSNNNFHVVSKHAKMVLSVNSALTSSAIIAIVVTIGKYFESKAKLRIQKMSEQIFPESTLFANMKVNLVEIKDRKLGIKSEKIIDASLVQKNDVIRVIPGRLLLDVIVIQGSAKAIQSARTGSEDVVVVGKGDRLQSGSEVKEVQQCLAIVENVLEQSLLVQIGTQIKLAQNKESSEESGIQALCKTISGYFVKGVIILSLVTMFVWTIVVIFIQVHLPICSVCWIIERGISVLVASCPCALGLAVPSVIAIILNLATKSGILIKNNAVFEKMKKAKVIAFDKTGTLFTRINKISEYVVLADGLPEPRMWEIIALVEKEIRHPLAQILYKEAFTRCEVNGTNFGFILLERPTVQKEGISVKILEKTQKREMVVLLGNKNILTAHGIEVPGFQKRTDAATEIYLAVDGEPQVVVMLNTHSNLRPEARDVIAKIKKEKLFVHILSGDSAESVEKLGAYLGIPLECQHPEQSTFNKMKWIKEVQHDDRTLAIMIGDGLNDIPCLQEAGIGISINAKSELNINAADVVILSENIYKILAMVRFLKRGNLFIYLNLFWAFAYNIVMLPIVSGALFPFNIYMSPVWSAVAMSCSSLIVVGFSNLLSCFEYDQSFKQEVLPEPNIHTQSNNRKDSSNIADQLQ